MTTYALDFETFYSDECSVSELGPAGYFSNANFYAYMVSVVGDDGFQFVGPPSEFDWSLLEGATVLSHNSSFDQHLYLFGAERGWWPKVSPAQWECTADLAAYLGLPRSLAGACERAFGVTHDKSIRNKMKGRSYASLTPEEKQELKEYALTDARLCLRLWQEKGDQWPEFEREISRLNRRIVRRGIPINTEKLTRNLEILRVKRFEAEQAIPWMGQAPLLSRKAFDEHCRLAGLTPPKSLAMDDPEADKFLAEHGQKYLWMGAVRNWRRVNALTKKLESFEAATLPDGRFYGGLLYGGAHTMRFSGSGGSLNLQNLPRETIFGIDIREMLETKPGRAFLIVDLSQIEVRTLAWLAGDYEMLKEIAASDDIYAVMACRFGLWSKEQGDLKKKNPELRRMVKAVTLGCGYQIGPQRFAETSGMSLQEACEAVDLYRSRMPKVVELWNTYQRAAQYAFKTQKELSIRLPSGRALSYGVPQAAWTNGRMEYTAMIQKQGDKKTLTKLFGGRLTENLSQALARDVFCDIMLRLDAAGHEIVLHVHDEIVAEVDESEAGDRLQDVIRIMSTPPEWIPDIPLAAEGCVSTIYKK